MSSRGHKTHPFPPHLSLPLPSAFPLPDQLTNILQRPKMDHMRGPSTEYDGRQRARMPEKAVPME